MPMLRFALLTLTYAGPAVIVTLPLDQKLRPTIPPLHDVATGKPITVRNRYRAAPRFGKREFAPPTVPNRTFPPSSAACGLDTIAGADW